MPKTFSEKETDQIRKALLEKGRELFSVYGLKKTGVADLTKAVGIAQGSFYKFYESKEELYFEILEREEATRDEYIAKIMATGSSVRIKLEKIINESFNLIETNTLIRKMVESDDFEILHRRLPQDKLEKHQENDTREVLRLITSWQEEGMVIDRRPEIIAGLFRSLFLLAVHKDEIGRDIYPEVVALLAEVVAKGLT